MKICYISSKNIHTRRWVEHFAERGHEVHLITNKPDDIDNAHIHVIDLNLWKISPIFKALIIRRLVKRIEPDILHAHQTSPFGLYGALSGYHPFILSIWGWYHQSVFSEKSFLHKAFIQYILKNAELVHCADEYTVKRIEDLVGRKGSARIIDWGIDPDLFKPMKIEIEGDEKLRILYLMRSEKPYGVETLLYAIPEVIKTHNNVQFLIRKSGRELNKTFDTVKKLKIEKYVEFVDDQPYDKVPKLMNSCDIYLDTNYTENPGGGIGMTALEAMSCGLPVVLSNVIGVDHYIDHKVNGYIYKKHDSNSLANALTELIENPELREELGKNAREYIVKNQNFKENMKIMESFYEKLAKGGAKP